MNVFRSKIFRAGDSDALRLPRELTPGTDVEVEITKQGDMLTIRPIKQRMTPKEFVEAMRALPKPSTVQKREKIIFPKRKGL